jgi:hypothetical protein
MTRSQYGFCQGECGADGTSLMPMALTALTTALP